MTWPDAVPNVRYAASKVVEALRPQPPLHLRTDDGEVVSGLAVLDAGRVLLFVGVRVPRASASADVPYRPVESPYGAASHGEADRVHDDQLFWPRPSTR